MQKRKKILSLLCLCCLHSALFAGTFSSVKGALGRGNPNRLRGLRLSTQIDWQPFLYSKNRQWFLTGLWDFSLARWHTDISIPPGPRRVNVIAAGPVIRLQKANPLFNLITPFADASVGASYLTESSLAHRNLGGHWQFQDLLGFGARVGRYELSWHYLHYSNANISPPNNGIDVKILLTLGYHFS